MFGRLSSADIKTRNPTAPHVTPITMAPLHPKEENDTASLFFHRKKVDSSPNAKSFDCPNGKSTSVCVLAGSEDDLSNSILEALRSSAARSSRACSVDDLQAEDALAGILAAWCLSSSLGSDAPENKSRAAQGDRRAPFALAPKNKPSHELPVRHPLPSSTLDRVLSAAASEAAVTFYYCVCEVCGDIFPQTGEHLISNSLDFSDPNEKRWPRCEKCTAVEDPTTLSCRALAVSMTEILKAAGSNALPILQGEPKEPMLDQLMEQLGLVTNEDASFIKGRSEVDDFGAYIFPEFVTTAAAKSIMTSIDALPFVQSVCGRWKQDYGPRVNFKKQKVTFSAFNGLPYFVKLFLERLRSDVTISSNKELVNSSSQSPGIDCRVPDPPLKCQSPESTSSASTLPVSQYPPRSSTCAPARPTPSWQRAGADFHPVELCVLDYRSERGSFIPAHYDDAWLWGDRLVTVNLVSDVILSFISPISTCLPAGKVPSVRRALRAALRISPDSSKIYQGVETPSSDLNIVQSSALTSETTKQLAGEHLSSLWEHVSRIVEGSPSTAAFTESSAESSCVCGSLAVPGHPDTWCYCCRLLFLNRLEKTPVAVRLELRVPLPCRGLFIGRGPARYVWLHAVRSHHIAKRRVALTMRELSAEFMPGGVREQDGAELLRRAVTFSGIPVVSN
eukprot:GHVT01043194.1.p1 GENE.GHVT01043194.1~~GHVT01043194.1.p1  ORF type:complete len:676 (-),score=40.63 GHVT01043194.1:430-2457(-)